MGEVAAQLVELPDHEHVALPQGTQVAVEARPVVAEAGSAVVVDVDRVVDAGGPQGVGLQDGRDLAESLRKEDGGPSVSSSTGSSATTVARSSISGLFAGGGEILR